MIGGTDMDWSEIIKDIFVVCIIPLLGVLTTYLINYIKDKSKYLQNEELSNLVCNFMDLVQLCVSTTQQIYVDELKKKGEFGPEQQAEAFEMTKTAILKLLTDEMREGLASIYGGDMDTLIKVAIEDSINSKKQA